jgi:hypothetical protein
MEGVATHPATSGADGTSDGNQQRLYWSKRGAVACDTHAPDPSSEQWLSESWRRIPDDANGRHGLRYQCPRCAPDGRPHGRNHTQRFVG